MTVSAPVPVPTRAHLLDRLIGAELPRSNSAADVANFEAQAPWAERVAAACTYQALQLGPALNPDAPAMHFLPQADPAEASLTWSYREFFGKLTQAANLFHRLGVGPGDVVSLLLPQAFVALYGAQAVGVANPVNPMLSAAQLAEILRAAGTQVLVTTGPAEGSELWDKVQAILPQLPDLRCVLVVGGLPQGVSGETTLDDFDSALARQPASRPMTTRRSAKSAWWPWPGRAVLMATAARSTTRAPLPGRAG